jgi:hypothetical protein
VITSLDNIKETKSQERLLINFSFIIALKKINKEKCIYLLMLANKLRVLGNKYSPLNLK